MIFSCPKIRANLYIRCTCTCFSWRKYNKNTVSPHINAQFRTVFGLKSFKFAVTQCELCLRITFTPTFILIWLETLWAFMREIQYIKTPKSSGCTNQVWCWKFLINRTKSCIWSWLESQFYLAPSRQSYVQKIMLSDSDTCHKAFRDGSIPGRCWPASAQYRASMKCLMGWEYFTWDKMYD